MKKRVTALALCALIALGLGLSASAHAQSVTGNFYDDSVVRRLTTVVYCLSEDRYRLVPDVRTLSVMNNETMLEVLTREVLQEPQGEHVISAMTERVRLYVLSVAQTGRVATVDLGGDAEMMQPYEMFCLKAALTNTLIETGQVDYVNVLFMGRELTTNDLPTGTLTRFDEDLQSAWIEHENEGVAALRSPDYTFKRYVTLFFASSKSDLLLAEVRQLTFTRSNLAIPVVSALISGPFSDTELRRSYPSAANVVGIPSFEQEDENTQYLEIDFYYEMANALSGGSRQRRIQLAPLVITLTTFLPNTSALRICVNRRPIESLSESDLGERQYDRLLYRSQFEGLLGRTVSLYFPAGEGRQSRVTRAIELRRSTLRDLIEELLIAPDGAQRVFPEGFTGDHLRGVCMVDDIAVVNFTQQGAELMRTLEPDSLRDSIFCIVNTLTDYAGVSRVQFLVEGLKVDSLSGVLNLRSPLVRNPGVIQPGQN